MKKQYDYLLVGSGLFAGVFAYYAKKAGKTCLVLEKREHAGGNIYCENIEGINVHRYGAHIFHTSNREVWNFVNSLVEFNRYTNSPVANYKGEMYNMPFNMNTFSRMWGISTPEEAKKIINEQRKVIKGEPKNLEEQAISLVGTHIYQKLVKGYTEKQWGRDCKELPAFIIKRLPVRYTYDNNYFNDLYQESRSAATIRSRKSSSRAVRSASEPTTWLTRRNMTPLRTRSYIQEPSTAISTTASENSSTAVCGLRRRS